MLLFIFYICWQALKLLEKINYFLGGYYIIERKPRKLHIVVLNTDLMRRSDIDEDASKQWRWLEGVLNKFEQNKEKVTK